MVNGNCRTLFKRTTMRPHWEWPSKLAVCAWLAAGHNMSSYCSRHRLYTSISSITSFFLHLIAWLIYLKADCRVFFIFFRYTFLLLFLFCHLQHHRKKWLLRWWWRQRRQQLDGHSPPRTHYTRSGSGVQEWLHFKTARRKRTTWRAQHSTHRKHSIHLCSSVYLSINC